MPRLVVVLLAWIVSGPLPLQACAVHGTTGTETGKANPRPNVVFILADDLGWRDLGYAGSSFYETPNIDRIAQQGARFTQGYAACQVCSPSRASIMTGKYPARLKITDWIGAAAGTDWKRNTRLLPAQYLHRLPSQETTIAEAFREAGYKTFFAGKWHLGGEGSLPTDHGFDINVGGHHRGSPPGGYFSPFQNPQITDPPAGSSLPLYLAQQTADFIEQNHDQPFLAFLSFYSVHAPLQTTQPLWKKYRDKAARLDPVAKRFLIDRTTPVRQVQDNPVYAGMVETMDDAVGVVLQKLDSLNLLDQTIVVFTSDNGGVSAGDGKATSNLPLRGGKGRQWEGGIREPLLIRYPALVAAGSKIDTPATGTDLFPTLLDMCGIDLLPEQHVDGVSLKPLFQDQPIAERDLLWHYPHYGNQGGEPSSIIRSGDWKLIYYYEDGHRELYQLSEDTGEQQDVASTYPERVLEMDARLQRFLADIEAEMPTPNPDFDPAKLEQQQQQIRENDLPKLEQQSAALLTPDYQPGEGWWGSQPPTTTSDK